METNNHKHCLGSKKYSAWNLTAGIRNRYLCLLDIFCVFFSYFLIFLLFDNIYEAIHVLGQNLSAAFFSAVIFAVCLQAGGVYAIMWVHSGTRDYIRLCFLLLLASFLSIAVNFVASDLHFKISFCAMTVSSVFIGGSRMVLRAVNRINKSRERETNKNAKRLLIVGAGSTASILLRDIFMDKQLHYEVVGLVDDDKKKAGAIVNGVKVLGDRNAIARLAETYRIDEILIAIPSARAEQRREIIELCNETGCEVRMIPGIRQLISGKNLMRQARKVRIEDLLARDPIRLDNQEISGYIRERVIMVTGGGGSIGSELCRQIMRFQPKKLVIVDIYENNAYDVQMELNREYPDNKPEVIIASVRERRRMDELFERYKPYIVFHAAAHKHVPLMEASPGEAIKNNVFGTYNIVKCADKYGVKRFVMISTDKAVNPTNVMGATKRMCEMIVQCMAQNSKTEFVAVRFGNVLGSNGSVIPLFEKQIAQGGPVTITHKDITRFFMTIPEAAQLVLQAASYAKGGEIFVLDMGKPVKIYDLAKNMIRLSGYKPDVDIKIEVTGLRPGEKLYEELLMNEEGLQKTSHSKIFIGQPLEVDSEKLTEDLTILYEAVQSNDNELIKDAVAHVVPTYERDAGKINQRAMERLRKNKAGDADFQEEEEEQPYHFQKAFA